MYDNNSKKVTEFPGNLKDDTRLSSKLSLGSIAASPLIRRLKVFTVS